MTRPRTNRSSPLLLPAIGVGIFLTPAFAPAHDLITTRVTWTGEISRIVQARCVSCHTAEGPAPMPLTSWQEARPWAKAIKEEVMTRRMPLWHAARGYGDFSNDPSLSPFEIALIAAWADGGAPRGTGADERQGTRDLAAGTNDRGQGTSGQAEGARAITLSCGDQRFPRGTLHGVSIAAGKGDSVGVAAALPDGRREIIAWIRDYDPAFAPTYWLRAPLAIPDGSRLIADLSTHQVVDPPVNRTPADSARCSVTLTMAAPR